MKILLLEPDYWRSLGILQILATDSSITVLPERDHQKILSLRTSPPHSLDPDLVIVSHSLTFDYQFSILRHLRHLFPKAQILVEGYDEGLDAVANVLRAGAKGYFQLSSNPDRLLDALAVVARGHVWAPREAVVLLMNTFSPDSTGDGSAGESEMITSRDAAILKLLQQGLSNKEIAQALGVAEVTIKSHLTKLYRKFGVHTRLELLSYAMTHHLIAGSVKRAPRAGSHHDA
ncbi:MAG: two-component system response regulator NarL [Thermoanaerobaculia bacterium]